MKDINKLNINEEFLYTDVEDYSFYIRRISEESIVIYGTDNLDDDISIEIKYKLIDELHQKGINAIDVCVSKLLNQLKERDTSSIYPIPYTLIKLNTLEDAEYPQAEKYPDGYFRTGFLWKHNLPSIGNAFYVFESKLYTQFRTSTITQILEDTQDYIIFKTLNSTYKIEYKK